MQQLAQHAHPHCEGSNFAIGFALFYLSAPLSPCSRAYCLTLVRSLFQLLQTFLHGEMRRDLADRCAPVLYCYHALVASAVAARPASLLKLPQWGLEQHDAESSPLL